MRQCSFGMRHRRFDGLVQIQGGYPRGGRHGGRRIRGRENGRAFRGRCSRLSADDRFAEPARASPRRTAGWNSRRMRPEAVPVSGGALRTVESLITTMETGSHVKAACLLARIVKGNTERSPDSNALDAILPRPHGVSIDVSIRQAMHRLPGSWCGPGPDRIRAAKSSCPGRPEASAKRRRCCSLQNITSRRMLPITGGQLQRARDVGRSLPAQDRFLCGAPASGYRRERQRQRLPIE